jgi:hypothetical protein
LQLEADSPLRGEWVRFPSADYDQGQFAEETHGARLGCRRFPHLHLSVSSRLVGRVGEKRLELGCASLPQPVEAIDEEKAEAQDSQPRQNRKVWGQVGLEE